MKRVALGALILAAMVFVMAPGSAHATSITFNSPCAPGTGNCGGLTVTNGGTQAFGNNIRINSVTIVGAPTGNGTFNVSSNLTGLAGFGALSFNTLANTISITGSISGLPGGTIAQQTLLSGSFTNFNISQTVNSSGQNVGTITASGPDTKAAALLSAIGLSPSTPFNYFGFVIGFNRTTPNTYDVVSAAIVNQTPEPESLLLLGTGLTLLAALLMRKGFPGAIGV